MQDQRDRRTIARTLSLLRAGCELRANYRADPHRPRYHFIPLSGWMNDINGPLFWNGRFHLFYQALPCALYSPVGVHWGHASSVDLVHWVHHPPALEVSPGGPDRIGCFAGGTVVHEGVPTMVYHGQPDGLCLATSRDPELIRWEKHPANPVIRTDPPNMWHGSWFPPSWEQDPCAWQADGRWYALRGGRDYERGDAAWFYRSDDLVHWEARGSFYTSERRWTHVDEDCSVPDFFHLGDRHVLLFGSHLLGSQYYVGRLEGERFLPECHRRLSWPGAINAGAITMPDGKGRRLFFTWLLEARSPSAIRAAGWAGAMSLPRVLTLLPGGALGMEPVEEIRALRYNSRERRGIEIPPDGEVVLPEIRGDSLELELEAEPGSAKEIGIMVRRSADGEERTSIVFLPGRGVLQVDASRSSLDPAVIPLRSTNPVMRLPSLEEGVDEPEPPLTLEPGEPLRLRVFLDRSVIEVFANGRQCIARRVYPSRADSLGVSLFCRGGSGFVRSLRAWDLAPANS
jgi:beta-fructofuranosidase